MASCPRCGYNNPRTFYRCNFCRTVFCSVCRADWSAGWDAVKCPACGKWEGWAIRL